MNWALLGNEYGANASGDSDDSGESGNFGGSGNFGETNFLIFSTCTVFFEN